MAGTKRSKAGDVIFEGVVIPRRTRSAKIAAQGIANEEDMARFLTAIFADTLNGKIVLPKPDSANGPERISNGAEQKLNRGLPVTIKAKPKRSERQSQTTDNKGRNRMIRPCLLRRRELR